MPLKRQSLPAIRLSQLRKQKRPAKKRLTAFWHWYENPTYPWLPAVKPALLAAPRKAGRLYKALDHPITVKDFLLVVLALLLIWALFFKDHHAIAEPAQASKLPKIAMYKPLATPKLAKQSTKAKIAPPAPKAPVRASGTVAGCGDNFYANFIYMKESGCRLDARNASSGACGIGQAYPCSKLTAVCPTMSYECQNRYFTSYAVKYGGWAGSYAFWLAHRWW